MRYLDAAGLRTSVVGLGTWQFGSREWGYGEAYAAETAPALVHRALELGITMFDTAEAYGPGRSERILAGALAAVPDVDRAGLIVATKFLPIAPAEPIVARQAAGSRRRLAVDALDLYYAHWPNPLVSVAQDDAGAAAARRRRPRPARGRQQLRAGRWQEAERALRAPVVANQVRFSLVSPGPAGRPRPVRRCDGPRGRRLLATRPGPPRPRPERGPGTPGWRSSGRPSLRRRIANEARPARGGAPRDRRRPRRHAGPGRPGVGDPAPQHRRDPGRANRCPARGERRRRGSRAGRRRGGPARRACLRLRGPLEGLTRSARVFGTLHPRGAGQPGVGWRHCRASRNSTHPRDEMTAVDPHAPAGATRTESDSMGPIEVPADHYWGAQTQRSLHHFAISRDTMPVPIVRAFGILKQAAADVNAELGLLPADRHELDRAGGRRGRRRHPRRRVPAPRLADGLRHAVEHERQRGDRRAGQRAGDRGSRRQDAGPPERPREHEPVVERHVPDRAPHGRGHRDRAAAHPVGDGPPRRPRREGAGLGRDREDRADAPPGRRAAHARPGVLGLRGDARRRPRPPAGGPARAPRDRPRRDRRRDRPQRPPASSPSASRPGSPS